jgi:peptidoglycan/LPS O-acetylase OafA/YrhL
MQRRIPQLDAVRGIAILIVMAHNISLKYPVFHSDWLFANGWMGVDLFFVLSGFLITGILIESKDFAHFFRNFYVRRILRIWPLYFALLFFMFVIVRFINPSEYRTVLETSSPWWSFPLFLQNFLLPISTNAAGPLAVTWSLAIEEQFYLVWPLFVRFCSSRVLARIAVVELCISPGLRYVLALHHVNLYTNVFCRLDGLMAGALLAVLVRSANFAPAKLLNRFWILLIVATPLAFLAAALRAQWIVFTFSCLASAALLYVALFSPQKWLQAIMKNPFLIYSGLISYGLYLLHKIPFGFVQTLHLDRHPLLPFPFIFGASYFLAALSWHFFEKPILSLKSFFKSPPLEVPANES